MTDRDTFAAAALTGFSISLSPGARYDLRLVAKQCFELADAMLRERERTNHDASPEARAQSPSPDHAGHRDATTGEPGGGAGTGNTQEPVAWAVIFGREHEIVYDVSTRRDLAVKYLNDVVAGRVVPLYRSPTLTENEIDALYWAMAQAEKLRDSGKKIRHAPLAAGEDEMREDMVARLRKWVERESEEADPAGLVRSAADEIERLRWQQMGAIVYGLGFAVAAIATAALFCSLMVIKG